MHVTPEEIPAVAKLVNDLCGVILDQTKGYLIDSRLGRLAESAGCKSFTEFCRKAQFDRQLKDDVIDAITTNETLFFRDTSPFDAMQFKAIPELIDAKAGTPHAKRLRIWSAASSTGQEAYSIAMVLHEMLPDIQRWDINILATDISDAAIKQGSRGFYANHEIQRGMKPLMLQKYFTQQGDGWQVKDELRSLVKFERKNLLEPFGAMMQFDVIFCRNVAIYFDADVRADLFLRLSNRLIKEGYLFVGSAECLSNIAPQFVPQHHCRSVFYRPNLTVTETPQHTPTAAHPNYRPILQPALATA